MPFETKKSTVISITPEQKEQVRSNLGSVPDDITFEVKRQKPRTLEELRNNPFPVFPHEIHESGPTKGTCKHCTLSLTAIQGLSLACTPQREKLRVGGW